MRRFCLISIASGSSALKFTGEKFFMRARYYAYYCMFAFLCPEVSNNNRCSNLNGLLIAPFLSSFIFQEKYEETYFEKKKNAT